MESFWEKSSLKGEITNKADNMNISFLVEYDFVLHIETNMKDITVGNYVIFTFYK